MRIKNGYWRVGVSSLVLEIQEARAESATIDEDSLTVNLVDSRTVIAPLAWYPRLWHGSSEERSRFKIIGDGTLIHWPELDEDLSVAGILAGRKSGESQESLKKWLDARSS